MIEHELPTCLMPIYFNLQTENIERVRLLLLQLQKQQVCEPSAPTPWVETLTNVLFEVLQHVGIIPSPKLEKEKQEEVEELRNVAIAFEGIRNNLIDFRN